MPTNPLHILMLALGIALAFIGLFIARSGRGFGSSRLSKPTQVVIGLCLTIIGYHLIVWVFPPTLTPLQVDRQFWWVLLAAGLAAPLLSLILDAAINRRGGPAASSRTPRDGDEPIR